MKKDIPINKIVPDPSQPRKYFGKNEMNDLVDSIRKQGILNPIIVENNYNVDNYLLLDGERRYRAALELGLTQIPATIIEGPLTKVERTTKRFHLQEQHSNWSIFDKAKAILEYQRDTGLTLIELAEKLNLYVPKIHGWLSMNEFTEKGKALIIQSHISFSYLIFLIRIVKHYLEICDMTQEEIEEKMINKINREHFKVVGDLQVFSKIMSIKGHEDKKIKFLNSSKYTFNDYLEATSLKSEFTLDKLSILLKQLDIELAEIISNKIFLSEKEKTQLKLIKNQIIKIVR